MGAWPAGVGLGDGEKVRARRTALFPISGRGLQYFRSGQLRTTRGHTVANLAAVEGIPPDGPAFLKLQEAYIGHLGTIPDTWRSSTEPYLRISEDANHGWYTEGFDFIPNPPHSRAEFILRVYDQYLRVRATDPERAKLLNIRYTGLQAYSIIEGYEWAGWATMWWTQLNPS